MKNILEFLNTNNDFYDYVQTNFAYHSNKIEGNKLNYEQVKELFRGASASDSSDAREIKNHFNAFDFVLKSVDETLSAQYIKDIHRLLRSFCKDSVIGDFKRFENIVGSQKTCPASKVKTEISALISEYNSQKSVDFSKIVEFHYKFERIHPFEDGNGRTGRLIMFKECLKHGFLPFILPYEKREFYYRGLCEFQTTKGYLEDTLLSCADDFEMLLKDFGYDN